MNRDEQMKKLSRASDWRAALIILKSAFEEDSRVWHHVNLNREEISFRKMLGMARFRRAKEYCCRLLHLSSTKNTASTSGRSLIDSMKQTPLWSLLRFARSSASKSRNA